MKTDTFYWYATIDANVVAEAMESYDPKSTMPPTARAFRQKIDHILKDPLGWSRFGYRFIQIDHEYGEFLRAIRPDLRTRVWSIRLSTEATINRVCGGLTGLSCASTDTGEILLHSGNWMNSTLASGLDVASYQIQITNHEIAHLLGRDHAKCSDNPNDPCPVTYQQTISKGCCRPNVYPLPWE